MKAPLLVAAAVVACAQSPTFEVASIKPTPPPDPGQGTYVSSGGGPGSRDPGLWRCHNMSLANLVSNAFELRAHELKALDWMDGVRFDITAKVPEGATRDQFNQMFQNMLIERFGLKFHREKKEMQGYELVVAKNGPKFKESGPEPPKDANAPEPPRRPGGRGPSLGADGFPVLAPGMSGMAIMRDKARSQWIRQTMGGLARNLEYQAGKPVVDATGLTGKYDISLYWVTGNLAQRGEAEGAIVPAASDPGGPTLFTALQEQLGLKLDAKKVTIEVLVVDAANKLPTEN